MIKNLSWLVYRGPPDILAVDQGTGYVSAEMRSNVEGTGIKVRDAPIENCGSIGVVERYHAPLHFAYERTRTQFDRTNNDENCMKLAVLAMNTTVGPEGICPALLVFGAIPIAGRKTPGPAQFERSKRWREQVGY